MKVRIVSDLSDVRENYVSGQVVDLPEDKAARFIKAGLAEAVGTEEKKKAGAPEAAARADAPEHATLPPAQKRGA